MIRRMKETNDLPLTTSKKRTSRKWSQRCFWLGVASFSLICGGLSNMSILERMSGWNGSDASNPKSSLSRIADIPVVRLVRRSQIAVDTTPIVVNRMATETPEFKNISLDPSQQNGNVASNIKQRVLRHSCMHTRQGASLVTDSNGLVCDRKHLNSNRCCPDHEETSIATLSTCTSCDASIKCCSVYEYCVSCCLRPEHRDNLSLLKRNSIHRALQGSEPFDVCQFKCRTSSGSNLHENSYRNPKKHCFGLKKAPILAGVSLNSDLSTAKERVSGLVAVSEEEFQLLDPYVKIPNTVSLPMKDHDALTKRNKQTFPCIVDECGALVSKRYP